MPIRDAAARRKSLRNDYGTDRAADAPDSHDFALFNGDPMGDGVEISATTLVDGVPTSNGYARVAVNPEDWIDDETEGIYAMVQTPDATAEREEATHWALYGDDGNWWDCGELAEPVLALPGGDNPPIRVPLFYADAITEIEE